LGGWDSAADWFETMSGALLTPLTPSAASTDQPVFIKVAVSNAADKKALPFVAPDQKPWTSARSPAAAELAEAYPQLAATPESVNRPRPDSVQQQYQGKVLSLKCQRNMGSRS